MVKISASIIEIVQYSSSVGGRSVKATELNTVAVVVCLVLCVFVTVTQLILNVHETSAQINL